MEKQIRTALPTIMNALLSSELSAGGCEFELVLGGFFDIAPLILDAGWKSVITQIFLRLQCTN